MKTAIYLLGHGPLREPYLVELQYGRIYQYINYIKMVNDESIEVLDVFVDLRDPLTHRATDSNLNHLLKYARSGEIDTVLVDIEIFDSFGNDQYSYIIEAIKSTGVQVINVLYDEAKVFNNAVRSRFGDDAVRWIHWDEINSLYALFPALGARIGLAILEFLEKHITKEDYFFISNYLNELMRENPYRGGQGIPLFSTLDVSRVIKYVDPEREKIRRERRTTEELWQLGPEEKGKLKDDLIQNIRSDASMEIAKHRLQDLAFTEEHIGQLISFQRKIDGYVVYADPRESGKIIFYIYKAPDSEKLQSHKRPRKSTTCKLQGEFYLLDNWSKDIHDKWMDRFNKEIHG